MGSYIESFWNGDRPVLLLLGEGKGTKIELDSDLDFKFAQEWILNTRYIRYGTSLQSPKEYAETELKKRKQVLESKKEELKKLEQYIEKEEQEIIETEVEKELA